MIKRKYGILKSILCVTLALSFVFTAAPIPAMSVDIPPKAPGFSFRSSTKVWGYNMLLNRGLGIAAMGINVLAGMSDSEALHKTASIASFILTGSMGGGSGNKDNQVYYEKIMKSIDEMCTTVVQEIDKTEQSIKEDLSAMSTVLGILNKTAKLDNYNDAWEKDVEDPLTQADLMNVIEAYKVYIRAVGDYTDGKADYDHLMAKKRAFADSFRVASGAVYDASSANGMTIDEFYDEKIYSSNAVDLKFKQAITSMLTRLEATDGTRYIDTAAQMAYTAYPFSTDQAEFVDNAARKQSEIITVSVLAYREFNAMRHEYIEEKLKNASQSGMQQSEYDALSSSLGQLESYGFDLFDKLFYGSDEIQPSSGVINGFVNWLESKIIIVNGAEPSYIYLDNYLRRTPDGTVTLENTSHISSVDYDFYRQRSKNGEMSPLLYVSPLGPNTFVKPEAFYNEPVYTSRYMQFEKTAVVIPSDNGGQALVRPLLVLANDPDDENDRSISTLYGGIDYLGVPESHIKYPLCDFYNLTNGTYTDGYNTYSVASNAEALSKVITDEAFVSSSIKLDEYFSSLNYYDADYLLTTDKTVNSGDYNIDMPLMSTTSSGMNTDNVLVTDISDKQFTIVLVPDNDDTYVPFECIVEGNGTAECEIFGYENENEPGYYRAGTIVAVNVRPPVDACCDVTGVKTLNYADISSGVPTSVQTVYSESNSHTITYNEDGSLTLAFRVPYERSCAVVTVYEYFEIKTVDDLVSFASAVNSGASDLNAILKNDIDISSFSSTIGTSSSPFKGVFDGNGYTLTNYNGIYTSSTKGIFSYVSGGTVKNLTVDGECSVYGSESGYGGIIGKASDNAQIINVHSSVDMTVSSAASGIGGIVGIADSSTDLYKCSYSGTVTARSEKNDGIGGIAGRAGDYAKFSFCINYGTISSDNKDTYMGGILGYTDSDLFGGMEKCINVGSIRSSLILQQTTAAGSIIGYASNMPYGCVKDCFYMTTSSHNERAVGMLDGVSCSAGAFANGMSPAPEYAMSSGQITYTMSIGMIEPVYVQTLGKDAYPVFVGMPVYLCHRYGCDGQELGVVYSNYYYGNEYNIHTFDDETHKCDTCGKHINEIYVMGDTNDDGVVNSKDIIRLKAYLNGLYNEIYFYQSDVDFSGTVDENDLSIVISMITE